jgi:hypothetical protein
MHIIKINNGIKVHYFQHSAPVDVLRVIQRFTSTMGVSVTIVDGVFTTDKSELFFSYLEEYEGFKELQIGSIQTISMRKRI